MHKVDNAVIMAAGTASRFAPISYERPKALIEVKGEVLTLYFTDGFTSFL